MEIDFLGTPFGSHFHHGEKVVLMAVNAAGRQQAENMHRLVGGYGFIDILFIYRVVEEAAVFNLFVDPGDVLINDATGAQAHVTDF